MTTIYRPGDIVLVDFGQVQNPDGLQKVRPAIIVSNIVATRVSPILQVVPLTTKNKGNTPTHVTFSLNKTMQHALCEQVTTISTKQIKKVTDDWINLKVMNQIKDALKVLFDL